MSKLVPYFKRGLKLFDTALNKTVGQYVVRPLDNYVLRPGTNIAYKGARKVYYLYNPKARKFNRMAEENVKKLRYEERFTGNNIANWNSLQTWGDVRQRIISLKQQTKSTNMGVQKEALQKFLGITRKS
jgi:hypothetical protein